MPFKLGWLPIEFRLLFTRIHLTVSCLLAPQGHFVVDWTAFYRWISYSAQWKRGSLKGCGKWRWNVERPLPAMCLSSQLKTGGISSDFFFAFLKKQLKILSPEFHFSSKLSLSKNHCSQWAVRDFLFFVSELFTKYV